MLDVGGLTREGVFNDVSLRRSARGEIVALAGLVGAGRSEVARAVFGIDRYDAGTVTVGGSGAARLDPPAAMAAGIGVRARGPPPAGPGHGHVGRRRTSTLASLRRLRRGGLLIGAPSERRGADWAARLRVKYGRARQTRCRLSGGNQQKVVLAKWLAREPPC